MINLCKKVVKRLLRAIGYSVVKNENLDGLRSVDAGLYDFMQFVAKSKSSAAISKAQLGQDVFALIYSHFKKGGFFVEFGATNGVILSNTYMLEKYYDWTGILAEPARVWHSELEVNRSAQIDFGCVWKESGKTVEFNEVDVAELSTIKSFNENDTHSSSRQKGEVYEVETISLEDLLIKHRAPKLIDFLSVDTEGSEYEILSEFNFSSYDIRVITVEHNYTANREKIYELLKKNGYTRLFTGLSKWDDWYVKDVMS